MKAKTVFVFFLLVSCKSIKIDTRKKIDSFSMDAVLEKPKIYMGKTYKLGGNNELEVLVVTDNKSLFAENENAILDTLSKNYKYRLLQNPDSIKKYSNLVHIKKILLISKN